MPGLRAAATYKKAEGTLEVNSSHTSVSWTPKSSGGPAALDIAVNDITNLQQTPAKSEKIALKIVVGTSENHVFNFTSGDARAEQESTTAALKAAISALRAGTVPTQQTDQEDASNGGDAGPSAAMAFAQAVTSGSKPTSEGWYDDAALKSNVELQQSLLKADPTLRQRFEQSLRDKPSSITNFQFSSQFWAARVHLLRAHAIEKAQSQGAYNVLAEVKPKVVDGAIRLNLSKEQIQLIFSQHPLVKEVYNEVVPKLSEREFWARFFVSRLFKKLKGERITDSDSQDVILDKYINHDAESLARKQMARAEQMQQEQSVPHFIDLEGNEQNHSQRKGNAPDFTMRPNQKMPILRVLNNMSERMLSHVAPTDADTDATFDELRLRDLADEDDEQRVVLNVRDQRRLFGASSTADPNAPPSRTLKKQSPSKTLSALRSDLSRPLNLARTSELQAMNTTSAQSHINRLIEQQHAALSAPTTTLSQEILTSLRMTHSTTTEFLHYFWTLLLSVSSSVSASSSGTGSQKELHSLLTTLNNSLARIDAVAKEAQAERDAKINELKEAARKYEARTGKRRKVDLTTVEVGGSKEVAALMEPTVKAIQTAKARLGVDV